MGDKLSMSRTILEMLFLFLSVYFIQYAVIPAFGPVFFPWIEVGSPMSWIVAGVGTGIMWLFIRYLLWNIKRERTVV